MEPDSLLDIRPQPGPQTEFLSTNADIAIYGGEAGGGKSYALILEPLHYVDVKNFRAITFRRTLKQATGEGGLWDEAMPIYVSLGGRPNETAHRFRFPAGSSVSFGQLHRESTTLEHQGKQYALIQFDELTHFSESQFFYMLSRNRSVCGVRPYIRATTNPDPDSWVARFIAWWIDERGFAIPERSGMIRHFVRVNDEIVWADSPDDLKQYNQQPMSVTFIHARLSDNQILMQKDPSYKERLDALDAVNRARLRDGNWKIRPGAGLYFRRDWFEQRPDFAAVKKVRAWDRAASKPSAEYPDPDWTVGVLIGIDRSNRYKIYDAVRCRESPAGVEQLIRRTADFDGPSVVIAQFKDPGSAGKSDSDHFVRNVLSDRQVITIPATHDKVTLASPVSSAAEHKHIAYEPGEYTTWFFDSLEGFPDRKHEDEVDSLSCGYHALQRFKIFSSRATTSSIVDRNDNF